MSVEAKAQMSSGGLEAWIEKINRRGDFDLSTEALRQIAVYCAMMRDWNQSVNLTSIIDDEGMAVRHILDSLMLLPWLDEAARQEKNLTLADIGTGAGLPGIPLKIARPGIELLLVDSLAKRVSFLNAVIDVLSLDGARAVHARAEDAARDKSMREMFSVVTARAVASLPVLAEYCLPFARPGGLFIAMKSNIDAEWPAGENAVRRLGGRLKQIEKFNLPGTPMQRTLLIFEKISPTPDAYPRSAGKPEKKPL